MQKVYPFKFLDSYQKEDKDLFFGRDEEIDSLYRMIFQTRILLVYGTSGTGKTSLIQCGLANRFQPYDWLALSIRRSGNLISSLDKALCQESDGVFTYVDQNEFVIHDLSAKLDAVYKASFKPIYLFFDQFEELYILGTKEEQQQFIKTLKGILAIEQPVKIILSIREEFLGYLYEFEKEIPQLFSKKLRVEPMTIDKVANVIRGINDYEPSLVRIKTDEIEAITEEIFKRLKGEEKTLTIQLPYLQVFMDKLYINITHDESHRTEAVITMEDLSKIGDIDDVLQDFLDERVKIISSELSSANKIVKSETLWKILSNFCTLEGTKEPISKKELVERVKPDIDENLIDKAVEAFSKSRILNKSEDEDLYEVAHDSLALRIAEKRSEDDIALLAVKRLIKSQAALKPEFREDLTEKQLNFIEPYLKKLASGLTPDEEKLIKDSKKAVENRRKAREKAERDKKVRRRMWVNSVFILIIIGLVISGIIGTKILLSYKLLNKAGKIQALIAAANSNYNLVQEKVKKDPTYALKLDKQTFLLLDSTKKLLDTISDKTYIFNWKLKNDEYKELDSSYRYTVSLIRTQANSIAKSDYALYKIVDPSNPQDALFDRHFVNGIFPDAVIDSSFYVWRAGKELKDFIKNNIQIAQVVFPVDSNAMVLYKDQTAQYLGTKDYYGKLDLKKGDRITSIVPIHYQVIGFKMLSALNNKRIVEWNLNGIKRRSSNKEVVYSYDKDMQFHDSIVSMAISPDRTKIFTASDNDIGVIWPANIDSVKLIIGRKMAFQLHQDTILCSAFSKDGSMIITGSCDQSVKIWNSGNGKLIKELKGHDGRVTSVAFSANNKMVYTGSMDKKFRQWILPDSVSSFSDTTSFKWNRTREFDSLFILKIIDPFPVKSPHTEK